MWFAPDIILGGDAIRDLVELEVERAKGFPYEPESTLETHILILKDAASSHRSLVLKRIFDLTLASLLTIIATPVWLVLVLLIKLTSSGPAIYLQKRVGKAEEVFNMYKFRTMIPNADELVSELRARNGIKEPIFKMKDDPRITPAGKWLRKVSLDELPQLVNVLKGEMSLVGPRPMPVDEVKKYEVWHRQRHTVTPGITGLWQVSGRSDLSFEDMIKLDLFYIQNRSLLFDLWIILRTIPVVLQGKGAY